VEKIISLQTALTSLLINNKEKSALIIKIIRMKKVLIASGVAVLAFAMLAGAQGYTFNTNLTVGSTGADVVALQTWLMAQGYSIPALSAGTAKGYFGSQTKAAVMAYQAAKGIPNTGFVGPLTRGALNGGGVTPPVVTGCPSGYICTPVGGTPPVVTPGAPIVMDGTDGSLTVSLSSYASNVTLKKGETKDMVAVKAQATAAPVSITRFDVRMDKRPWLYFTKITLSDSSGTVIATKNLSASTDATEITVGSDYLVRFENISYTVSPGTDKILVVSGTAVTSTDKLGSDVNVVVSVPTGAIRTVNGKGYTDSLGLGTVAQSGTTGRTVTLTGTGSTANILARVSPNSPAQRIQTTSTSGQTNGVVLGMFDFKSENSPSTINTLTFTLKDNGGNKPFSTIFKRVYLEVDGSTYQVDAVATSSVFSNLTVALPLDTWKTVTLKADVADQDDFTNGAVASTTMAVSASTIVGIDSGFNTTTSSGGNTITSNDVTFLQSGASITNQTATAVLDDNGTTKSVSATITFGFTLNNTGNTDLYISANPSLALATSSTVATAASTTIPVSLVVSSPSQVSGDSAVTTNAGYYIIPSSTSRSFVYSGTLDNKNGTVGLQSASVTKVYFDDDTTGLQEFNVNFGLEKLKTPALNF
jgi:peptidoglycan hydrolase-like protein with peptidoglycan-binding domain